MRHGGSREGEPVVFRDRRLAQAITAARDALQFALAHQSAQHLPMNSGRDYIARN